MAQPKSMQSEPMPLDMENRDPNNMNEHVRVLFEDTFGEPEGTHSIDGVWVLSHLDDWTLCALLEDEFVLSEDVLELMRALSLRPMLGSMRPVSQPHPCTKQKRIIYWSSPHQLLILTLLRSNVTHVDIAMVPKSVVFFHHKDNPTMSNYQTVI
ncbi:caveolin 3 [Pelobates cultripes]|uniref:Caveolin n=1 Tax=Pelobates cultripes TaxID=61616 RepID=A0AAD1SZM1_PELCU|nr:caveolin 3 [Pelobates cultripes]